MNSNPEKRAVERARLLAILARERPERKPGARTRAWEVEQHKAREMLRKLDSGEPTEPDAGW